MSSYVLYGSPSEYDKNRDRVNKPHAFFYFQADPRYEAVVNVESREGGEPDNDMLFRVLVSNEGLVPQGSLIEPDVEVATPEQTTVVAALLQQVQAVAIAANEPNIQWFPNQFNYQRLWTDQQIVTNWLTHPHQGPSGLFERLQNIYDNFESKRWYFIGKKFSSRGLDMVHMNAGVGSPDGLILIQVEDAKWVAVFFAFQVDFYDRDSEARPFRPHPPTVPSDIEIIHVNYNPPGDDAGKESITLRNNGAEVNLKGWKITASRGSVERRYVLPPLILYANNELEIFVSKELFPNRGATVTLRDPSDTIRAATEY